MSSRQWLTSALRQIPSRAGLSQQLQQQPCTAKHLSTSAPAAALKHFPSSPRSSTANPGAQLSSLLEDDDSATPSPATQLSSTAALQNIYNQSSNQWGRGGTRTTNQRFSATDLRQSEQTKAYMDQMPRRWQAGDLYAPRDLSPAEMRKWHRRQKPKGDIIDVLGVSPLDNYRNFSLIADFITPFGRIKHSSDTGLRPVNQRKIAKTVRRAIGLGIHPSVHKHPELLVRASRNLPQANIAKKTDSPRSILG
ncbi:ribosomal protein S18 [Podospora appendiculata]|uniref:Small ribosomal subunit protein bS18m n=1 Tax=Podospora appendiculata TaxID=314037 RepID=A0AAE1C9T8_9PEZI|nr:ribosomal protein S18 [Podospora appendiculata]